MTLEFTKYHGLGNDFILIDNRQSAEPILAPAQVVKMCDRHFGVGADGVIFVLPPQGATDYTMRILNSDGSEPEMCGNGIRCFARFVAELEPERSSAAARTQRYQIHTLAGLIAPELQPDGLVTVDMGRPQLTAAQIPTTLVDSMAQAIAHPLSVAGQEWAVTCVSMGNPHCVTFVAAVDAIDLPTLGPQFEHHAAFPQRTNVEFVEVVRPDYLKMRVWERGAGITLACGTGACATVVAGVLHGQCDRAAIVELPGGCLQIRWDEASQHIFMTGPATKVFTGTWNA